eukprot:COSAG03_NODE_12_length_22635_cov_7.308307_16_plen_645_part_01
MFNRTMGGLDVAALTDAEIEEELQRLERLEVAAAAAAAAAKEEEQEEEEEQEQEEAATEADQLDRGDQTRGPSSAVLGDSNGEHAPPSFLDPISHELMRDPVMVGDCGMVYERASIEAWFAKQPEGAIANDPLTGTPLASMEVRPVHALRNAIQEWIEMQTTTSSRASAHTSTVPDAGDATTPILPARAYTAALENNSRTLTSGRASDRACTRQLQAQERQLRVIRAQRAEQRRRRSAAYRFRVAAAHTAVSQQSIGLTLITIVAGLFLCMVEYSNQKYPGAGASQWTETWRCELRSARVECQDFGTQGFTLDSQRERCRTAFTIARQSTNSAESENQGVQLQAYRYPTAVFIDTAAEAEAFLAEVIGAANVRLGGSLSSSAWINSTVPCRCGTLLETQRCGHCECGEYCSDGQCRCVCPEQQESGGQSDFSCGCAAPHGDSWSPCPDGHCQLGSSGTLGTEWDVVYNTGLTGSARIGLLVSSLAVVWAGFSCCAYSATLLDRNASAQLAVAMAAIMAEKDDQCVGEVRPHEDLGSFRADLAAAVSTSTPADDVVVDTNTDDGATAGGAHKVAAGRGLNPPTLAAARSVCRRPDCDYTASSCCCWSGLSLSLSLSLSPPPSPPPPLCPTNPRPRNLEGYRLSKWE